MSINYMHVHIQHPLRLNYMHIHIQHTLRLNYMYIHTLRMHVYSRTDDMYTH